MNVLVRFCIAVLSAVVLVLLGNSVLLTSGEVKQKSDPMKESDKPPEVLIVVKFRGQKEGSAGIAFPDTSRLPNVDFILSEGAYFRNLKDFREKMKSVSGLKLYIPEEKTFERVGYDSNIFQAFEEKLINEK